MKYETALTTERFGMKDKLTAWVAIPKDHVLYKEQGKTSNSSINAALDIYVGRGVVDTFSNTNPVTKKKEDKLWVGVYVNDNKEAKILQTNLIKRINKAK